MSLTVERAMTSGPGETTQRYTSVIALLILSGALSALCLEYGEGAEVTWLPGVFSMQWLPGFLFGIAVALGNRTSIVIGLGYASLTGAIYYCVTLLYIAIADPGSMTSPYWRDVAAGFVAGGTGAALVFALSAYFFDRQIQFVHLARIVLTGFVCGTWFGVFGGLTGNNKLAYAMYLSSWTVWQAPVGLLIHRALNRSHSRNHPAGSFENRLVRALQGPTAQLLGFLGTVLSILSVIGIISG